MWTRRAVVGLLPTAIGAGVLCACGRTAERPPKERIGESLDCALWGCNDQGGWLIAVTAEGDGVIEADSGARIPFTPGDVATRPSFGEQRLQGRLRIGQRATFELSPEGSPHHVQGYDAGELLTVPDIDGTLKSILVELLGVDEEEITPTAVLEADLGADSLDVVELVLALEEAFGLEIPDSDAERWLHSTVTTIANYFKERGRRAR